MRRSTWPKPNGHATERFSSTTGLLNQFQIFGKNGRYVTNGPHLVVARDASRVGVGRTPAAYALEVEGDASKTVAGSWLANSDARIKTDVRTIEGALETLAKLRPVAFRYTAEHRAKHPSIADRDYNNFIAQEYREVFPDAVKEDGEGLLSVDTYDVQPYLVRAVQELHGPGRGPARGKSSFARAPRRARPGALTQFRMNGSRALAGRTFNGRPHRDRLLIIELRGVGVE
jgi:hypothetical protein